MTAEKKKILVVDDIELNRLILTDLFEEEFEVLQAENGKEALDFLSQYTSEISIVLLDLVMPVLDGFGVLQNMWDTRLIQSIPVILITGENDDEKSLKGFELGVSDLISKPFNSEIVYRRVINVVELYAHKQTLEDKLAEQKEMLERQAERLHQSNQFVIDALSTTVEFRSSESGEHIKRIRGLTKILLEAIVEYYPSDYPLTREEISIISSASAMHDIGKISIPDSILLKPGPLTNEEFDIMKTHTIRGCDILSTISNTQDQDYYKYSYEICRHHHERWDGSGYPNGLKGTEIPIQGRIMAIADVYDALVSIRPYKKPFTAEEAENMIMENAGTQFDPHIAEVFYEARQHFADVKIDT
ncbi:MAG: response regulator [Clostridiales bacterium]|nr:response regulator [Clostridiales bacterium]